MITRDLMPRLYKEHSLVLPGQEPSLCLDSLGNFATHISTLTKMRSQRTTAVVVQVSEVEAGNEHRQEAVARGEETEEYPWDDDETGDRLAEHLTNDVIFFMDQIPSIEAVNFIFWFGNWVFYSPTNGPPTCRHCNPRSPTS